MDQKERSFVAVIDKYIHKFFTDHEGCKPESGLYKRVISEVEISLIYNTLKAVDNNKLQAAKILRMNRNTLHKKIRELNIKL